MNISCHKVKTDLNTGGDSSLLNGGRLLKTITVDTTQQLFAQVHIIKIIANLEKSVGIIIKYLYCSVFINLCILCSELLKKPNNNTSCQFVSMVPSTFIPDGPSYLSPPLDSSRAGRSAFQSSFLNKTN